MTNLPIVRFYIVYINNIGIVIIIIRHLFGYINILVISKYFYNV